MRQHIYDADTAHKNFWCCYAKVFFVDDRLRIINTLNEFAVTLAGREEALKGLYDALCTGVDDDVLSQLLSETGCKISIEELLYKGIIE